MNLKEFLFEYKFLLWSCCIQYFVSLFGFCHFITICFDFFLFGSLLSGTLQTSWIWTLSLVEYFLWLFFLKFLFCSLETDDYNIIPLELILWGQLKQCIQCHCSSKSYTKILTTNIDGIRRCGLWEITRGCHESRALKNRISRAGMVGQCHLPSHGFNLWHHICSLEHLKVKW